METRINSAALKFMDHLGIEPEPELVGLAKAFASIDPRQHDGSEIRTMHFVKASAVLTRCGGNVVPFRAR